MPQGTPPSAQPPRPHDARGYANQELEGREHTLDQSGSALASPGGPGASRARYTAPTADELAAQGTQHLPSARTPQAGGSIAAAMSASSSLFEEALTEAVARLNADGGELVTFEPDLQAFLLRARVKRNPAYASGSYHARGVLPGMAQSSRPSQPLPDEQPTVVMPSTAQHIYPLEGGIRGLVFARRYPIMLRAEEIDQAVRREDLPAPDASFLMAVPVFRPSTQGTLRPEPEVIGVLTLYVRNPMWPFSHADTDLLVVLADRLARTLTLVDLSREKEQREALLRMLESSEAVASGGDLSALATQVREVASQIVSACAFALVLVGQAVGGDREALYVGATWEGTPVPGGQTPRRASTLPQWWPEVARGRTVRVSSPDEVARHRDGLSLGWETPQPLHSLVALPLATGRGRHPLGALVLADTHVGMFASREVHLLRLLAQETALLIEGQQHASAEESPMALTAFHGDDPQHREREVQLAEFSNAVLTLNASLELEATADALVQQAAHFTQATARMVFLLDEKSQCLQGTATNWEPEDAMPLQDVRIPLAWQALGDLLRQQSYAVLRQLNDDWPSGEAADTFAAQYKMASCLVLPMEQPGYDREQHTGTLRPPTSKILGALFVFTPEQPYHGSSKEIQLLQTLVRAASRAISNAQLYHNLEQAYEKQKELDRYKDDFILTVSHEFRTPMTTIEGYTGLIKRHGEKLDRERLTQYADEIKQAMDQLTGMLGTLADVNRMDNDSLQVALVPVNATEAARTALSQQTPELQPRVTIELPDDLWVMADDERLPRLFGNLIGNALKYTETTCRVTAHPATREDLLAQGRKLTTDDERWTVIGVQDYGTGITPEDQARLFQKFVRLAHSRTSPVRGTGLGLWICKEYMKAFHGDIWVESSRSGSVFAFCLPVASPPSEA